MKTDSCSREFFQNFFKSFWNIYIEIAPYEDHSQLKIIFMHINQENNRSILLNGRQSLKNSYDR